MPAIARRTLVLALLGCLCVPSAVALDATRAPDASAATPTTRTAVMGPNLLSANELARWYNHKRGGQAPQVPSVANNVTILAQLFIEEGRREGVRGDLAFVQSVIESAWFTFPSYGQIRPSFNNFAGLFAYDGRPKGTTCAAETAPSRCFASARLGIRNQIHLLRGYADASSASLPDRLRLPPADRRGVAAYWELFGGQSGTVIWATAHDYGLTIIRLYSDALVYSGARAACLPYSPTGVSSPSGRGYWVGTADGGIFSFGDAAFHGSISRSRLRLNKPVIGAESTSGGRGYWQLGGDGGIFSFGDARFYGSTGGIRLNKPVNGMERTDNSRGYWLVAYDGGIFAFGNAPFYGSMGGTRLNKPMTGMERTKSGRGYWLFADDGGIFAFGDARFYGSLGGNPPRQPVVSMQRTASGRGYWMMDRSGKVHAFGDARDHGDIAGCANYRGAARMLVTPTGGGYWIATTEGSVIPFGDARRLGMPTTTAASTVGLMLRN